MIRFLSLLLIGVLAAPPAFANRVTESDLIVGQDSAKDYLKVGNFERNVRGWSAYADAAGAVPVDCTGGSPTVTITRTTTDPIAGDGSGVITRDAANRQGEGVSAAFTLDREASQNPRILRVTGSYEVSSGTFQYGSDSQASDVEFYLYDVTASQLIYPSANRLVGDGRIVSEFQPQAGSTSFRLCAHVPTTTTTAFTLKVDNIRVSQGIKVTGPVVSELANHGWVPTIEGFGAITLQDAVYQRKGNTISGHVRFVSGVHAAVAARISLPHNIDHGTNHRMLGRWLVQVDASTSQRNSGGVIAFTTDQNWLRLTGHIAGGTSTIDPTSAINGDNVPGTSGRIMYIQFWDVPIAGWSSNQVVSSDQGTREVIVEGHSPTGTLNSSLNDVSWTETRDTTASFDGTTFTAPESATYDIDARTHVGATRTTGDINQLQIWKNGTTELVRSVNTAEAAGTLYFNQAVQASPFLIKGDTIKIRSSEVGSSPSYGSGGPTYLSIRKRASPQQIAASEVYVASVFGTTQGITEGSETKIELGTTRSSTTHSGMIDVGNDRLVAAVSGPHTFGCQASFDATPNISGAVATMGYKVNGGSTEWLDSQYISNSGVLSTFSVGGRQTVSLNKGDYVECYIFKDVNSGASTDNLSASRTVVELIRHGGIQ